MEFNTESLNTMGREVSGFVENLIEAANMKLDPNCIRKKYSGILICGMGASAIGGAIISDCAYYRSDISVETPKTMALPHWVDKDTLLVACSYSGNTYETVEMYKIAKDAGLDIIVVTHGGKLMEMAESDSTPLVRIGGEQMQPRSAIGWFIGILGLIVEAAGGPDLTENINEMADRLRTYREELESEDSIAWKIARGLGTERAPVVYGSPDLEAIAVRMKNQLNENSKIIAFSGILPEFNHNEIVGWYEDRLGSFFYPIVLVDDSLKEITSLIDATVKTLEKAAVRPVIIHVKGRCLLERSMYALMVGDYTSIYIAALRGVDPCNVDPITVIKKNIADNLKKDQN